MKIMKLTKTQYFDDDGYCYDTFKECKENSNEMYIVKPQKCKIYEIDELNENDIFTENEFDYYVYSMKGKMLFATNSLKDFIKC